MSTLKVNTIDSHSGSTINIDSTADVSVDSATSATSSTTGALKVTGGISTQENLYVGGNAVITGTMTANGGTITLGDAGTDNVTIGGEINSDVIPDVTNTYDLGSSSKKWAEIHATTFTGALTGNVTGNTSGSAGSCTGNSATATALATGRTVGMTGDVVWTSAALDGTGNVTGTAAIQSDTVAATELGVTAGTATALKALVVDASKDINLGTGDLTATVITGALTGNASTASAWATARTLELTGAVTGSASVDGSGNVSMATTATADPTITLAGDLSGAVTLTNLGNGTLTATVADDSHNHVIGNVDGLQAALDLKATLASPTLTGAPIAPTAAANTNTTQIATTAYVQTELTDLIGGAPGTLDTLNELAFAINDDASYASTLTTALATKTAKTSNQSLSTAANAMTISGHTITLNRGDGTTDTVIVPDNNTTYSVGDGGLTEINFTPAANTKLTGIEASADVTDTTNVVAALTAGTNVTISAGGTISSTDTNTTYSAGAGLDLTGTAFSVEPDLRDGITHVGLDSGDYIGWTNNSHQSFFVNAGERVRIEADGDLHADGDVIAYSTTISDERLKTGITTVTGALDKVKQIRGVEFTRKNNGQRGAGVIAQELEKVLPQAIKEKKLPLQTGDETTLYKTVEYDALHALLIEAVKELSTKIDKLENK